MTLHPSPLIRMLLVWIVACWALTATAGSDPEALALLRTSERNLRGDTSEATYRVELVRPDWQRTLRFHGYDDRLGNRYRIEVLEPRKSRGTVFLKVGNRLSMVLPKLRREIAISPAMMQDPWMGSDFNNQDLLESGAVVEDYDHHIIARDGEGPQAVLAIESIPKPEAGVVWGRLVQRFRADGVPLDLVYYDSRGTARRRLIFSDVQTLDGHTLPTRWTMTPLDKPGQHTEIILEEIHIDIDLPENLFHSRLKDR